MSTRRYAKRLPAAERREQLLDAALRVLVRDGYGDVTVEAIAREAGVTRPVVYAAYDGLDPLLHALLDRTQQRAFESAVGLLRLDPDVADVRTWVVDALAGFLAVVEREPDVWRPVLGLVQQAPAVVQQRIAATREHLRGELAGLLQRGLERAGRGDLDADVLAHLMATSVEQLGRLVLDDPDHYDRGRLVAAVSGMLAL